MAPSNGAAERRHLRFWPQRLPQHLRVPDCTLATNLEVASRRYGGRDAIRYLGARISYAHLHRQVEALAGWLQRDAGVAPGDRVMVCMQNAPQLVAATYAVLRADAVVVPVNPMNRAEELRHVVSNAGATVAVCTVDLLPHLLEADAALPPQQRLRRLLVTRYTDCFDGALGAPDWRGVPAAWLAWLQADATLPPKATGWPQALMAHHVPRAPAATADDLAVMPYTSGTTGFPKGCMHSHRSVMHNVVGGSLWGAHSADSVVLSVVPLFHVTGMLYGMHAPIFNGSTTVMMPRWDRDLAARLIAEHAVTHWTNIPTMVIDLLASPNAEQFDLSSLRYIGGGGAAMPHVIAERLRDRYGLHYLEGYGLSETAAPSHGNPPDRPKLQCLGIPTFDTDARVVDPVSLAELGPGEVGEIIIRGPQLFQGYWNDAAATEAAFVTFAGRRYFRSGDLGRTDEDGYFFLTDRLKRMINASGFKVWPAEVETLLFAHPAVQEACVIGTVDAYRGESVKAVIVLRPEAHATTAAEVIGWAREHMAAYKVPREVAFVDSLPKSGAGKVMWRLLQDEERRRAAVAAEASTAGQGT